MAGSNVAVFEMNDCDWWAGTGSAEDILKAYMEATGLSREQATDDDEGLPRKLSEEELDSLSFALDSEEGERSGEKITFRERLQMLIQSGQEFPCLFASTEY